MIRQNMSLVMAAAALTIVANASFGAVTPDEAAHLKTDLTPFGAEKAGNKDGTIPAWDGGLIKPLVPTTGDLPADQYPNEKPLFVIDQKNVGQYTDKLSEGQRALIAKYPDYNITVYPTHRTFAAPQWVYDNDLKNALNAQLTDNGQSVKGVYGGTPFPIPKSGIELYWNHTLRYLPPSLQYGMHNFSGNSDGTVTMTVQSIDNRQSPYYEQGTNAETWNGLYNMGRLVTTGPAFKAGEQIVILDGVNPETPRQAWQYLVGQRRVRRAPTIGYDTPDFVASGTDYFDEIFGFWGAPDRYDWKLIGKKEMFVPYNENRFFQAKIDDAMKANHPASDKQRWELHRVWVVEMTLAPGKRHVVPRRTIYFDEDSYAALMMDGYDADGKLWRTSHMFPLQVPDLGCNFYNTSVLFNLQANTYGMNEAFNEEPFKVVPQRPDSYFSGDALASEGVR